MSMEKYVPHSAEMSNEAECLCSRTNQVDDVGPSVAFENGVSLIRGELVEEK